MNITTSNFKVASALGMSTVVFLACAYAPTTFSPAEKRAGFAQNWQIGFQTPASPIMEGIVGFHDDLMIFLVGIVVFVMYIIFAIVKRFAHFNTIFDKEGQVSVMTPHVTEDYAFQQEAQAFNQFPVQRLVHASTLEIVWTIIPALILLVIAIPSFSLLYSVDEILEPLLTIKVIGHQWYWSYELLDLAAVAAAQAAVSGSNVEASQHSFDSYMVAEDDLLNSGSDYLSNRRLLTVDNHLFVPANAHARLMITSADVLHSWAVPALGVKVDACPGRLNQTSLFIKRAGLYYGQCSEICGVNHGFMPIGIVSQELFLSEVAKGVDVEAVLASLQAAVQN